MKLIFTTIILVVFNYSYSFAQYGSIGTVDAKSMGTAKTYNALSTGVYSLGINPANLPADEQNKVEISTAFPLPFLSVRTGTDFLSIDDLNFYFGGVNGKSRVLNDQDKKRFNDLFKDGGFGFANVAVNWFAISFNSGSDFGALAFSINDFAGGKLNFPQAIVDIALTGNPKNKVYSLNDSNLKSWWIRNYSLSYAKEIPLLQNIFDKFRAGISIKLVHGFSYAGTDRVNTEIRTGSSNEITGKADLRALSSFSDAFGVKYDFDSLDHNSSVSLFNEPAGTGVGFDIGFSAVLNEVWNLSLAVTDIGSINWNKNTAQFTAIGDIYFDDIANDAQIDTLVDKLTGKASPTGEFKTDLPTAFRFGISRLFKGYDEDGNGEMILSFDYNQGFNDMPGNSQKARVSLGFQWKPAAWIPYFRTGIAAGGDDGFNWAIGLGFDAGIVVFDIATSDLQALVAPNVANQVSIAFGSRWKF